MDYTKKGWKRIGHVTRPDGHLTFVAGDGTVYAKDAQATKRSGHKKSKAKGRSSRKR